MALADFIWFCSMDWGFNAPGCILWWLCLPDGHYHIASELKFQQMSAETVAEKWHQRNRDLGGRRAIRPTYVVCDPSMKARTGHGRGESIMETLTRRKLPMKAGDNDRKNGWLRLHELLRPAPDGIPWLTVEPTCAYLIRSFPAQMSDKHDPDDVDTHGDDHAIDAARYGALSRPPLGKRLKVAAPIVEGTLAWYTQAGPRLTGILSR